VKRRLRQLPGNSKILFNLAVEFLRGEWGPSQYQKNIELFEKLLLDDEYTERAAFYLDCMYLRGKVDDTRKIEQTAKQTCRM
jgi:hypothetical protein